MALNLQKKKTRHWKTGPKKTSEGYDNKIENLNFKAEVCAKEAEPYFSKYPEYVI